MNSILTSVKKLLGIAEECTDFDADIIMYINMALFALVHGTMITSWVKQDPADLEMARQALPAILGER